MTRSSNTAFINDFLHRTLVPSAALAMIIFIVAMVGVISRPLGFLAALWPVNSVFLGLLVLKPQFARPSGWIAALIGYLFAGYVGGDPLEKNFWLTFANLVGVGVGYFLLRLLGSARRSLSHPLAMLHLFLIASAAACAAAAVGTAFGPMFFGYSHFDFLAYWFTSELSNYLIVLPALLTAGKAVPRRVILSTLRRAARNPASLGPIIALMVSFAGTVIVGGPGSIAFSVPALLWCALSYRLFPTAVIVMIFCTAMMWAAAAGYIYTYRTFDFFAGTVSFRLGLALLALGPLTVANITNSQRELLTRLDRAASVDGLTDILARRAFLEQSAKLIERCRISSSPVALMMIDVDHFKAINDRYGHAAGDVTLIEITRRIRGILRGRDVFGRLGGEEFAVLLAGVEPHELAAIAQRCRSAVEKPEIRLSDDIAFTATISIGIVHAPQMPEAGLPVLLRMADQALYDAKESGRNQVSAYPAGRMVSPRHDHFGGAAV